MPGRYAIANWKMNVPPEGIDTYLRALASHRNGRASVVVAPPFLYLKDVVSSAPANVAVGGQNCADQTAGALTGEVSPTMLRECGARFVIVGHSERRSLFGESDAVVARKLTVSIESGLTPIFCIGEDQKVRDAGEAAIFVSNQVRSAAVPALQSARDIIAGADPGTSITVVKPLAPYVLKAGQSTSGTSFLVERDWDPGREHFGILPQIYGTLYTSILGLSIATVLMAGAIRRISIEHGRADSV